jgi:fatty-acyl-CoA synthase
VIGVPDPKYGEELVARIKPRSGAALTDEHVREYCRGTIAHYMVPRYVKFVDEFPMTVTGKVRTVEMHEQSIAELGLA